MDYYINNKELTTYAILFINQMSNLGLSIIGSNNSKLRIYPFNSNDDIAYSLKINDNNHIIIMSS